MPVRSPYPDVEIPEVSLFDFLFTDFGDRAEAPGVHRRQHRRRGHASASCKDMVLRLAAALAERGIGAGSVVGIFAPNSPQWAAVFHGILRANATVTSVNSLYTAGELAHQLADSGAELLFTISPFLDRATAAMRELGRDESAIVVLDGAEGFTSLRDLLATHAPSRPRTPPAPRTPRCCPTPRAPPAGARA